MEEQKVIVKTAWFSLRGIDQAKEVIYPLVLPEYLPDILKGSYPEENIWIDLGKSPLK